MKLSLYLIKYRFDGNLNVDTNFSIPSKGNHGRIVGSENFINEFVHHILLILIK